MIEKSDLKSDNKHLKGGTMKKIFILPLAVMTQSRVMERTVTKTENKLEESAEFDSDK